MNYVEEDLIMLSALSHYMFCVRRCALIHIEQQWEENVFTAEGKIMHERVHEEGRESKGEVRIEHGVSLRSLRFGLVGKADVIEYLKQADGRWHPFPVEYKRGKPKKDNSDAVQLCAQAMCLEEMLDIDIPAGALFYGKTRRRKDVEFNTALRQETENTAFRVHELLSSGITPTAEYERKCDSCSLFDTCMPKTTGDGKSVKQYLDKVIKRL